MGLIVLILIVVVVFLMSSLTTLKERVERIEANLLSAKDTIGQLAQEVLRLQRSPGDGARAHAPSVVVPPVTSTEPVAPPAVEPAEAPHTPAAAAPTPVPAPPASAPVPAAPTPPPATTTETPQLVPVAAASEAPHGEPAESWEMTVGTSWLNKIGVFVFVIGLALLVGYSFTRIGPAGRVAIGYALGLGLLGTGVWLERQATFRNYAYGLLAGGWAGVYFTTFAMHEVPAAKVIDSDALAALLLFTVAGGMVTHSLRYRSQVVTALAFIVAYATLALSPVSGFSLVASVPLAVSVLVVSQRLGWPAISALGIIATYGAFVLRGSVFPGGVMDPASAIPYLTLAAYWATFEAADLIGLRLRRRAPDLAAGPAPISMLALNAIGLVGTTLVVLPSDDPMLLSRFLFGAGIAYVASATLRAWMMPERVDPTAPDQPFDTTHAASGVATALFAFAIGLRFSDTRETLALLLETQLLFTAGLVLRDVWLRRFGSIVALLATAHAWSMAMDAYHVDVARIAGIGIPTAVAVVMAVVWYVNRELLTQRSVSPSWAEPAYTWAATGLLFTASFVALSPAHQAAAGLLLAALLLDWGVRRGVEYVLQAYLIGLAGAYEMVSAFLAPVRDDGWISRWGPAPTNVDEWTVLPLGILLTAFAAWRLLTREDSERTPVRLGAAAVSAALSTVLLLIFEWRVLAPNAVAPAWALTALGLTAAGAWRHLAALRWQGYAVVLCAALRAVVPLIEADPKTHAESASVIVVIAAMYATGYVGRRGQGTRAASHAQAAAAATADDAEAGATAVLSGIATASFALWKYRVLPRELVAPAWAATAVVLAVLGDIRSRAGQRWQGYALAMVAAAHVSLSLLEHPTATMNAAAWAAIVGGLVYASAWIAQRHVVRHDDPEAVSHVLLATGTVVLALTASRVFSDLHLGPIWTMFGVVLLMIGLWRRVVDLRWQAFVLLALGALRAGRPVFSDPDATGTAIAWLGVCIAAVYACSLVTTRAYRSAVASGEPRPAEDIAGNLLSAGGTALLAMLILQEVRDSMVTLALGVQGLGLMVTGLLARERVMRLMGLALLGGCILKLFVVDLRELEALARILSFVALGLFLLGISWAYTRYREQLSKFL